MKRNYYIFTSGKLIRRQNTLYFEPGKSEEPIESDEDVIELRMNLLMNELKKKSLKKLHVNQFLLKTLKPSIVLANLDLTPSF